MSNQKFKIGDIVRSKKNHGLFGRISQVYENEVLVEQNGFLIKLNQNDIEITQQPTITDKSRISIKLNNVNTFNDQLDLHGYTKQDAIEMLYRFVDKAQVLGYNHIKIIHGKGSGILRTEVRNILKKDPRIKKVLVNNILFKGGSGVTWAELV